MVNRGEEKVWVQMNVVPRSTLIYTSELILSGSTICVPSASLLVRIVPTNLAVP